MNPLHRIALAAALLLVSASAHGAVWRTSLDAPEQFREFSKRVGAERFTKFVIDLRSGELLFFDVNVHELHTHFVFRVLEKQEITSERLVEFNHNYGPIKPKYLMGYLVHHVDADRWTLSFYSGDRLTAAHLRHAWDRVRAGFWGRDRLEVLPDSTHQARVAATMPDLPVVTRDALYKSAPWQPFSPGSAVGPLVVAKPGQLPTVAPDSIVILPHDLPDLPVVAGVVTAEFSTPLAHVALRARARGIPHAGIRDATTRFRALEGEIVLLEVTREDWTLRKARPSEIARWKRDRAKPKEVRVPPADLSVTDLRALSLIKAGEAGAFGAKAANLGEVMGAQLGLRVPNGFVIPVAWYAAHLKASGRVAATTIEEARALRTALHAAPVDPALWAHLTKALERLKVRSPDGRWSAGVFVRSSTNAEDLEGFSGAGLYETVPNVRDDATLKEAVRRVWASVWSDTAFAERAHFGIDQSAVYGAILVQVAVPATASGVLVTADVIDPQVRRKWTINAKSGLGMRVVEGRRLPEQLQWDTVGRSIRVVSRSDEATMLVASADGGVREVPTKPGAPVLTDRRVEALCDAAATMAAHLGWAQPLDVEWVFVGDVLHVVQVRPFVSPGPGPGR